MRCIQHVGLSLPRIESGQHPRRQLWQRLGQFVLKARGVEEPTEALLDEWDRAQESNAYLLSDTAGLVCAYFQQELTSRFRSERCVEADRFLTVPGDPAVGGVAYSL